MNKVEVINKLTRTFHKATFQLKKHSPEILVVTGVIGTVASTVMACKATTKVSTIMEDTKDTVDLIHEGVENGEIKGHEYTAEDGKKDLAITYVQTGLKLVKLYAPAVILGTASLGCMVASHNIMRKRNVALAAAYATVDKGFKEYRNRVIDRFGEKLDKELRYNLKAEKVEKVVTDPETGKEKKVKETVEVIDPNSISDFARFFDDGCRGWDKDAEHNLFFLKQQQSWANERLKKRGYLFLNEVYESLGIQPTRLGAVSGWIYDEKNPIGDNFVDFGIYDANNARARDFVNGYERTILLDFNCDGNILKYFGQ